MTVPILPGVLTTPTVLPDGYDATADPTHLGCAGAPANRSLSASRGEVAGGQSGSHDAGRTPRWAALAVAGQHHVGPARQRIGKAWAALRAVCRRLPDSGQEPPCRATGHAEHYPIR